MNEIEEYNGYTIYLAHPDQKDASFWQALGPLATSPDVHKTLAGPVADTEHHSWLLATKDGRTVAISSYTLEGDRAHFNETYVIPDERGGGLYERLFDLKYDLCVIDGAKMVKGMANGRGRGMFEKRGWTLTRETKNWAWFEKETR